MKSGFNIAAVMLSLTLVMVGCETTGTATYSRQQTQQPLTVYSGTVLKISEIQIQRTPTGLGAVGGGVVGGVVGSTIGGGRGRRLATTAGAVAGAAAGSATEKAEGLRPGFEIEIELDDGRLIVVVQEKDDEFAVGDRVRLLQSPDGTVRVRQ